MLQSARSAVIVGLLAIGVSGGASAGELPSRVVATYDVEFNGLQIGSFDFTSQQSGSTYNLAATGKLSLLFGAIKWSGESRAIGQSSADATRPQTFSFSYQGAKKPGSMRLAFTGDTVTSIQQQPEKEPKPGTIPVLPTHLKGVLDPMSATLALTKAVSGSNPCARRIPVFDGKERFDLQFSPRGTTQIAERKPSGQPGNGVVCRVKYVPISGHRPDEESKHMQRTEGIEIVLRPIPSANVYVPYTVTVPTILGNVRIISRHVDITTSQQQIALFH